MYIANDLNIVNGRTEDDHTGTLTLYNHNSYIVVDYVICSGKIMVRFESTYDTLIFYLIIVLVTHISR